MDLLPHASVAPTQRRALVVGVVVTLIAAAAAGGAYVLRATPELPPAPSTPSQPVEPVPAKVERKPAAGDRALKEWLVEIADDAGLGLVVGADLERRVTAVFPDAASWEAKLDALSATADFHYVVRDKVIEVKAGAIEEQHVAAPPLEVAQEAARASDDEPPDVTQVVSLRPAHARAVDLAKVLDRALAAHEVHAAGDAASNSVLLSGPAAAVDTAVALTRELDVPRRRFLVEAEIVEMLTAARGDLGIQWRVESEHVGAAANFPTESGDNREGEVTIATGGTVSLKARMSALEADGRARVTARPRVLVVEGTQAVIESVRILRIRLPESTSVVAGGGDEDEIVGGASGKAVEEFPVGITLRVEPSLLGGDKVALRVTAKSSTLGEPLPPDDIPEELSRLVEADFFVADGETAVLGGLARVARARTASGIPVLRDLPLFGALFGRRAHEHDAEELVVLVTPHLLE